MAPKSDLTAYLRAQAARPFAWGEADCVTFIADWVLARAGIDPAAAVRGRYASESEGARYHAGFGGLARPVGRALRLAGLAMTREPGPGDVAVVAFGGRLACAIRTGRGFALRMDDGLAMVPAGMARVVAAWIV